MNITLLYNKPTNRFQEADADTLFSVKEIAESLEKSGHGLTLTEVEKNNLQKIYDIKADLVFNLVEWAGQEYTYGVEVLKILEKMKMPFTGSNSNGYKLTCDKVMMKKMMNRYMIPTPNFCVFNTGKEKLKSNLSFPLIVKPAYEHCSIGLTKDSVVNNMEQLIKQVNLMIDTYKQPVIVEEFVRGKEIQVTLLEQNGVPIALPPIEVKYVEKKDEEKILTYDCKWRENTEEYKQAWIEKAVLPDELMKKVIQVARLCFEKLGGRDYPRVDLRIDDDKIFVLEINNNPGIGDDEESCIGYSANLIDMNFDRLVSFIVENAVRRWKGSHASLAI